MNTFATRVAAALMLCAVVAAAAPAPDKTSWIKFHDDVTVDGTVVKKGDYKLKFDAQAGELTILKDRGKVVAKTKARLETLDKKPSHTVVNSWVKGESRVLKSITFEGQMQAIVVGEGGGQAASSNDKE